MSHCSLTVSYQDAPPWLLGSPLASPLRSHEAEGEAAPGAPRHHHWSIAANTGEVSKAKKVERKEARTIFFLFFLSQEDFCILNFDFFYIFLDFLLN